jgi:hypothetical protein
MLVGILNFKPKAEDAKHEIIVMTINDCAIL